MPVFFAAATSGAAAEWVGESPGEIASSEAPSSSAGANAPALKAATPGSFTFILEASREVPKRTLHPKRATIGLRVPDHAVALALLEELGEPILSCTLQLPGDDAPLTDPYEIRERLEHLVDLVIDGGWCGTEPTTVIDMTDGVSLVRAGKGDPARVGL